MTLAACALLAFGLSGCASTQSAGAQVDDAAITTSVKAKLAADPEVNPFNIDVDTTDGVVRLSGTVEDPEAKTAAVGLARNTDGVRRVIDEIRLGETTVGERVEQSGLATKVKAKIAADPELNPFNIDVDGTGDGVITLSGTVRTEAAREEAEQIARNTDGVRDVRNRIEVADAAMGSE